MRLTNVINKPKQLPTINSSRGPVHFDCMRKLSDAEERKPLSNKSRNRALLLMSRRGGRENKELLI